MNYFLSLFFCCASMCTLTALPPESDQINNPAIQQTSLQQQSLWARTLSATTALAKTVGEKIVSLYHSLLSLFNWNTTPPLVAQLQNTKQAREDAFTQQHIATGISPEVAHIAGVFDRAEDDYHQLVNALASETKSTFRRRYTKEIDKIDDMVDDYLDEVQETLGTYQDKAFEERNIREFTFIRRLLAREFIHEMLD